MANKSKIRLVEQPKPAARRKKRYDRKKANHGVLRRTAFIMVLCGVLIFIPLLVQLFRMMILEHDKYEAQAINNQIRAVSLSADRGVIYDRNMNRLADSKAVENVFVDPLEINESGEDKELIATGLAQILGIDPDIIRTALSKTQRRYETIATKQELDVTARVRTFINDNHLTGIHLEPDTKRYYPNKTVAAQVIGFTNSSNTGSEGLEMYYDAILSGTPGAVITTKGNYETQMINPYNKYYAAENGNSLVLTIDLTVQEKLEKNLQTAIEKYDVQNGAFAMMMDVNTGAILGCAVLGGYDPNQYLEVYDPDISLQLEELGKTMEDQQTLRDRRKAALEAASEEDADYGEKKAAYEEAEAAYQQTAGEYNEIVKNARLRQWRNRCVSDGYEPGSTFKTITLAAALEEGAVGLNHTFYCAGEKDYRDREDTLHCWKKGGHGYENTAQALQNSCNIAFADIGILLGGDKLYDYIEAFGLLERTGVDMSGEARGVFHPKSELMQNAQLTTVAFGQSVKPTPIQMVRAVAAVVNGGYVLQPYVVSEIRDEKGNVLHKNGRTVIRQAISEDTSKLMCELMESVVTLGTAGNAKLPGYRIGGKTGTSEKLDVYDENGNQTDDKIVSFVGVAPMDNPQYIVLVALDTPSRKTGIYISGGVMAAPVVRDIFADTLLYLGVQPDYTDVDMKTVNVQMPDVRDMTAAEAAAELASQSLTCVTVGSGELVTGQIPEAGSPVPGNSEVIVYLGEPVPTDLVEVPNLSGMTSSQAEQVLKNIGLYLQTKGSTKSYANVTDQDYAPGTEVPRGTTVTAELTDATAQD